MKPPPPTHPRPVPPPDHGSAKRHGRCRVRALALGLLAASHTAALPTGAAAQEDASAGRRCVGDVRDDGGRLMEGATVRYHGSPRFALRPLAGWPVHFGPPEPTTTATSARGIFRIDLPGSEVVVPHGALEVVRPAGRRAVLGAAVPRPAERLRVLCRQMAEVRLGGTYEAYLRVLDTEGVGHYFGHRRRTATLRLPAGNYRMLLLGGDRVREVELRLRPGAAIRLPEGESKGRTLALPQALTGSQPGGDDAPGAAPGKQPKSATERRTVGRPRAYLRDWPEAPLPRNAEGAILLPGGDHPLRVLLARPRRGCTAIHELWVEAGATSGAGSCTPHPVRTVRITDAAGKPVREATVLAVRDRGVDRIAGLRVLTMARTDTAGRAAHAAPPRAPVDEASTAATPLQLLVLARGFAATLRPITTTGPSEVVLTGGARLELTVLDPRGDPAASVAVEFVGDDGPELPLSDRTDERGTLVRTDLPRGVVRVRLQHPTFLAEEHRIVLRPGAMNRHTLRARPGFELRGRILLPDGNGAAGAVVTVRDTTGLAVLRRTTVARADGSFRIRGLPEHARIRLSARRDDPSGNLISEQVWVQPDGSTWQLTLKREDPEFPGRKRR